MKKSQLVFAPLFIALAASMVACGSDDAGDKPASASEAVSSKGGFNISYDVPGVPAPASKGGFTISYDVSGHGAP